MHKIVVNGVEIFPFSSEAQLLNYVNERKGILIAINAEKDIKMFVKYQVVNYGLRLLVNIAKKRVFT